MATKCKGRIQTYQFVFVHPATFFFLSPYLFFLHLLVASLQSQKMADLEKKNNENGFIRVMLFSEEACVLTKKVVSFYKLSVVL